MGVAAAIAFVLFAIILLWTLLQMRVQRERA
jgi:ABC-type sugar transport system permease subunit